MLLSPPQITMSPTGDSFKASAMSLGTFWKIVSTARYLSRCKVIVEEWVEYSVELGIKSCWSDAKQSRSIIFRVGKLLSLSSEYLCWRRERRFLETSWAPVAREEEWEIVLPPDTTSIVVIPWPYWTITPEGCFGKMLDGSRREVKNRGDLAQMEYYLV